MNDAIVGGQCTVVGGRLRLLELHRNAKITNTSFVVTAVYDLKDSI